MTNPVEVKDVTRRRFHKGMVGIEAAIVLIAFVIVAAALAFVVLNMGFVTTQRSQQVISSGLGEASTALEVDGSVLAYSEKSSYVNYTVVPIKVSPGRSAVDLHPDRSSILYWSSKGSFADVYIGYGYVYFDANNNQYNVTVYWSNGTQMLVASIGGSINITGIWWELDSKLSNSYDIYAVIIWIDSNQAYTTKDTNLEIGEKAIVLLSFDEVSIQPKEYDVIKIEIKPPEGATLTIERTMPPGIPAGVIDLG